VGEIERTERLRRQTIAAGKGTQTVEYIADRGGRLQAELDRIEAQSLRVARKEQNADGERWSRCAWHE
jgi:hypothetical protein